MARSNPRRSETPARRTGRPPRLSRKALVEAGLALLERAPGEPLTVARIAAEVHAVPAALYRHFPSIDDLLDAVLGGVLGGVELEIRRRARWPGQIRDWMTAVRNHLLRYPGVIPLLGRLGRTSPPWLDVAAALVAILEKAGLEGPALARAHLWVTETTIGIVIQEASLSVPDQIRSARASLPEMSEKGRALLEPLMPHLADLDQDDLFEFVVERTVSSLTDLLENG